MKKKVITIVIILIIILVGIFIVMKKHSDKNTKVDSSQSVKTLSVSNKSNSNSKEAKKVAEQKANADKLYKQSEKLLKTGSYLFVEFNNSRVESINTNKSLLKVVDNHIVTTGYYVDNFSCIFTKEIVDIYPEGNNKFKITNSQNGKVQTVMQINLNQTPVYGMYYGTYTPDQGQGKLTLSFGKKDMYPFYNGEFKGQNITAINASWIDEQIPGPVFSIPYNKYYYSVSPAEGQTMLILKNNKLIPVRVEKVGEKGLKLKGNLSKDIQDTVVTGSFEPSKI